MAVAGGVGGSRSGWHERHQLGGGGTRIVGSGSVLHVKHSKQSEIGSNAGSGFGSFILVVPDLGWGELETMAHMLKHQRQRER